MLNEINMDSLVKNNACDDGKEFFLELFGGEKGEISVTTVKKANERGGSILWAYFHIISDEVSKKIWKEYKREVVKLLIKHNKVQSESYISELKVIRKKYNDIATNELIKILEETNGKSNRRNRH